MTRLASTPARSSRPPSIHPKLVGVDRAAGQQEGVVIVHRGVGDLPGGRERSRGGGHLELAGLDLARMDPHQFGLRPRPRIAPPQLFHLDPLDAIGGQDRDLLLPRNWFIGTSRLGGVGLLAGQPGCTPQ